MFAGLSANQMAFSFFSFFFFLKKYQQTGKGANMTFACHSCLSDSLSDSLLHSDPVYQKSIRPVCCCVQTVMCVSVCIRVY